VNSKVVEVRLALLTFACYGTCIAINCIATTTITNNGDNLIICPMLYAIAMGQIIIIRGALCAPQQFL